MYRMKIGKEYSGLPFRVGFIFLSFNSQTNDFVCLLSGGFR
jgi:hypothetical protein